MLSPIQEILKELVDANGYDQVLSELKALMKIGKKKAIVLNSCFGGFGLSEEAQTWLQERGLEFDYDKAIPRDEPLLVDCVKALGDRANSRFSSLRIVVIPEGVSYSITEYDGIEDVEW